MGRPIIAPKITPRRWRISKPHYLPHPWPCPTYHAKQHPDPIHHFSTIHWTDTQTDRSLTGMVYNNRALMLYRQQCTLIINYLEFYRRKDTLVVMKVYTCRTITGVLYSCLISGLESCTQNGILPWFIAIFILAFSALTLLVGRQEGHPARKNSSDEVLAWLSSGAKCKIACIWFSWCHCHPIMSASAKSRMVYPSGTDSPG